VSSFRSTPLIHFNTFFYVMTLPLSVLVLDFSSFLFSRSSADCYPCQVFAASFSTTFYLCLFCSSEALSKQPSTPPLLIGPSFLLFFSAVYSSVHFHSIFSHEQQNPHLLFFLAVMPLNPPYSPLFPTLFRLHS